MLILLSPAKKLSFDGEISDWPHSLPQFKEESAVLAGLMRKLSASKIKKLAGISEQLAELNFARWQRWQPPKQPQGGDCRQAVLAFQGDVYQGLQATQWTEEEMHHAQQHLRILSGLHGLLQPLDLIRPYRLEMGTRLKNPAGSNLYSLWQKRLTASVSEQLRTDAKPWLLNLASAEYSRALDLQALQQQGVQVISPVFQNPTQAGDWRPIMFHAKRARGMMADWAVREQVSTPEQVQDFASGGYRWQPNLSDEQPVFRAIASD